MRRIDLLRGPSARRTRHYSPDDWRRVKVESEAIGTVIPRPMDDALAPDEARAIDAREAHRLPIDRWFYPCAPAMHAGLADLWEADPRFAESIDAHGEGLTPWLAAAVRANAKAAAGRG